MDDAILVVPCYNEEDRLDPASFVRLAAEPQLTLLFVDDGSRDRTADVLRRLVERTGGAAEVLSLPRNRGKAEAVRQGMLRAVERGAGIVGYADADLSTPVDELARLLGELRKRNVAVVLGARANLLGTAIERDAARHYLGRVFATVASLVLRQRVYDTQCGAKLFRNNATFRAAIARPFVSRWAFDVELIGRLLVGAADVPRLSSADFLEVPLRRWVDVGGSKLTSTAMVRAGVDLLVIGRELQRLRRAAERK